MRIGYNCLAVDPAYAGGVNTYVFGLLRGFREVDTDDTFVLFVTERNRHLFAEYAALPRFRISVVSEFHSRPRKMLSRIGLELGWTRLYEILTNFAYGAIARRMDRECDVIHTPTTVLFPLNCAKPTSVSVHDIQQVHYPEFFSARERRWRKVLFRLTEKRATYIQASSEFIRDDWATHFPGTPLARIFVAHEGVDFSEFSPASTRSREVLAEYGLPEKFLFFPAQLWHHKNHLTVLRALRKLRDEAGLEIPLVLTGQAYSSSAAILDAIREWKMTSVHYLGKVPFPHLKALYAEAYALITAVLYESSSLCVLEAAASHTAVIASDTPPNREMSEIIAMKLFSPLDADALADLLNEFWRNEEAAKSQAAVNSSAVHHYSWANSARAYLGFFRSQGL